MTHGHAKLAVTVRPVFHGSRLSSSRPPRRCSRLSARGAALTQASARRIPADPEIRPRSHCEATERKKGSCPANREPPTLPQLPSQGARPRDQVHATELVKDNDSANPYAAFGIDGSCLLTRGARPNVSRRHGLVSASRFVLPRLQRGPTSQITRTTSLSVFR